MELPFAGVRRGLAITYPNRLHRSNRDLQKKNDELYQKIQRLKVDFELIENIARTELGMVGKDEVVYQFKKPARENP